LKQHFFKNGTLFDFIASTDEMNTNQKSKNHE